MFKYNISFVETVIAAVAKNWTLFHCGKRLVLWRGSQFLHRNAWKDVISRFLLPAKIALTVSTPKKQEEETHCECQVSLTWKTGNLKY